MKTESWRQAKELAKEFGMSEATIRSMNLRQQIRSKFIQDENGKKVKLYSGDDLAKRKERVASGVAKSVAESTDDFSQKKSSGTLPDNAELLSEKLGLSEIEKKRFLSALMFTKLNAESFLKSEQALAKMRENLVDEKHLIDIRTLQHDLENLFSTTWTQLKEQIDAWQIRYNFPAKQAKEMLGDYSKLLEKIRGKAKALGNAPSAP